jgi:hypothetical protein
LATSRRSRASGTETTSRFLLEFEQSSFFSFWLVIPCEIAARCVQRRTREAVPIFSARKRRLAPPRPSVADLKKLLTKKY